MYWNGVCVVLHCSLHKSQLAQSFVGVVVLNAQRAVIFYGHTGVATTITSLASFQIGMPFCKKNYMQI